MLASLLIHVQLAAYWCLARCPLMLSFLSALGTDRKIINTNLKSPFRKGGIETRNMRNFANYHVDVRRHTSGVVKTICEQCLPTRHNKRDRSLRVNIDTGHCHCYHCGADFYVPTMPKSVRKPSDRLPVNVVRHLPFPAFPPSGVRRFEDDAFRSYGALAGRDALHSAVRHRRSAHHGAGRVHVAIRHERAVRLFQLF